MKKLLVFLLIAGIVVGTGYYINNYKIDSDEQEVIVETESQNKVYIKRSDAESILSSLTEEEIDNYVIVDDDVYDEIINAVNEGTYNDSSNESLNNLRKVLLDEKMEILYANNTATIKNLIEIAEQDLEVHYVGAYSYEGKRYELSELKPYQRFHGFGVEKLSDGTLECYVLLD